MDEARYEVDCDVVTVTHPDKVMFPRQGWTKRDLVEHYVACVDGALAGVFGRPTMLKCFPRGVGEKPYFRTRAFLYV